MMLKKNYTEVSDFILLGLTDWTDLQPVFFMVFLVIYLIIVIANVSMILLIRTDSKLQTPMYFFLSHLSFVYLCYATNVPPQMLVNIFSKRKNISFLGWVIQFHFFIALVITDYYILAVMAYDCYVAICKMSWDVWLSHVSDPSALQMVLPRPFWCPVSPSVDPTKSNTFTMQTHLS